MDAAADYELTRRRNRFRVALREVSPGMLTVVVLAACLVGICAWAGLRPRDAAPIGSDAGRGARDAAPTPGGALAAANGAAAARLWRLAFAGRPEDGATPGAHHEVRDNVIAMLAVDSVDPSYFPRRPTLMPQLLRAVDDPQAASEQISRIIAHDPVLTADLLRLANSGLYRTTSAPVESIHRAIVVCGVDALRAMLAAAMLRPVFRATSRNFPRFPRILWERTERAARAAELYAAAVVPADRFEAQMAVLLAALGPLVVYSSALAVYARNPQLTPSAQLCTELIGALGPAMASRIAREWQASPRLQAALDDSSLEFLATARRVGELLGSLVLLESHAVIDVEQRRSLLLEAGIATSQADELWSRVGRTPPGT